MNYLHDNKIIFTVNSRELTYKPPNDFIHSLHKKISFFLQI